MIITKTPFRISLGGGGTDLPSYCRNFGGFIFGVAINLYFKVFVTKPVIDEDVHVRYSQYEAVAHHCDLKHNISRESLKMLGVSANIDITFQSDTPAGTGLGSSGSCAVGLLNALHCFKERPVSQEKLAQEAFKVTQNLGWPDGAQDPYLAALGGFVVLEIDKSNNVTFYHPEIAEETVKRFLNQTLLFYTGVRRNSADVLGQQDRKKAIEAKHITKEIGLDILKNFELGDLDRFGVNMRKHWALKKQMSSNISSDYFDSIYDLAIKNGAMGGKLIGAGGGGYFLFYCSGEKIGGVKKILSENGLRQVAFGIDYQGTRFLDVDF
ncbi:galactokinase [Candidatus Parcubacteria bacterium]|nr:MAG: galactokinase [Candidatus Parcubacteria bacterium]